MNENFQRRSAIMQLMLFFLLFFLFGFLFMWLFDFFLLGTTYSLGYYAFEAAIQSLLLTTVFKWTTIKTLIGKKEPPDN